MSAPEELLRILEGYDVRDTQPVEVPPRILAEVRLLIESQAAQIAELTGKYESMELRVRDRDARLAEWHAEVARFNRGWERRAEPYEALGDEFEQMGHTWANYSSLRAQLAALRREREELQADFMEYAQHLGSLPPCRANPSQLEITGKCDCGLDAARQRWSRPK